MNALGLKISRQKHDRYKIDVFLTFFPSILGMVAFTLGIKMKTNDEINDNSTIRINGLLFSHSDIKSVVDSFYRKVEQDDLLKIPFRSVHDWPEHIKRLTHFWWIRFGGKAYMPTLYDPVSKHFLAGFNETLLNHWLNLFHQTLDEKLKPDQSMLWKALSKQMGQGLSIRNQHLQREYENENFRQND